MSLRAAAGTRNDAGIKGFVFALDESADPVQVLRSGVFGVRQPGPGTAERPNEWDPLTWGTAQLNTLADLQTARPGDLVFFFQSRFLYGPAKVIALAEGPGALLCNYPNSHRSRPGPPSEDQAVYGPTLDPEWRRVRAVLLFSGAPVMFRRGIDMDEALNAYPGEPWPLHYWGDKSFSQLVQDEALLLQRVFLRRFTDRGEELTNAKSVDQVRARAQQVGAQPFSVTQIVRDDEANYLQAGGELSSEALLHALIAEELRTNHPNFALYTSDRSDVFHELPASPTKAQPKWVDWMDIVACRSWPGSTIPTYYSLLELKKGRLTVGHKNTIGRHLSQPMRYVDFLNRYYTGGNMHAVDVHLIAHEFSPTFIDALARTNLLPRAYTLSERDDPPIRRWQRVRLLRYEWDTRLRLIEVAARWSDDLDDPDA